MTIAARAYIEHPDLALAPTIAAMSDATIRVLPQAGTDPEHDTFPFLVRCDDCDAFEAALENDHTVASFERIAEEDGARMYHIRHTDGTKLLTPKTTAVGGMMVDAESSEAGWVVQLRLPDRRALNAIWEYTADEGIRFDLTEVYREPAGSVGTAYGLTEPQREALTVAYERGYFEMPREATLDDVADALGISQTAASGRLRRGIDRLIATTLFGDE